VDSKHWKLEEPNKVIMETNGQLGEQGNLETHDVLGIHFIISLW
jgi:hypothetical protein